MKKILMVVCILLIYITPVLGLEWPTENQNLLKLFAQKNDAHISFSKGLVFADANTVRASEHGKHLINLETKNSRRIFPSTLGNAVIFIQEDGLQTIYGNLKDTNLFSSRNKTETGSVIGQTGNSAWAEHNSLIFQVVDIKKQVFINPLLLLPAIADSISPRVDQVLLKGKNNNIFDMEKIKALKQGQYNLYANIYDKVKRNGYSLSPFRVTVSINGINVMTIPFEILKNNGENLILSGAEVKANSLYQKNGSMYFGKINLTRGKTELAITVRDITGNKTVRIFSFLVK